MSTKINAICLQVTQQLRNLVTPHHVWLSQFPDKSYYFSSPSHYPSCSNPRSTKTEVQINTQLQLLGKNWTVSPEKATKQKMRLSPSGTAAKPHGPGPLLALLVQVKEVGSISLQVGRTQVGGPTGALWLSPSSAVTWVRHSIMASFPYIYTDQ